LILAYDYLRRVENAVQMMRDEQVHSVPEDETDQLRLLVMMDHDDWNQFRETLAAHQTRVREIFDALFEVSEESDGAVHVWAIASAMDSSREEISQALSELGIEACENLIESLDTLARGAFYQRMTAVSKQRMDRILPLLLQAVLAFRGGSQWISTGSDRSSECIEAADPPVFTKFLVGRFCQSPSYRYG